MNPDKHRFRKPREFASADQMGGEASLQHMKASHRQHLQLRALILLLFFCSGLGLRAEAGVFREFYVAPTGADANPGTQAKPFLTLAHARDVVRRVNHQMKGDIVVYLRGGTYPISAPV